MLEGKSKFPLEMPKALKRITGRIKEGLGLKDRHNSPSPRISVAAFGKHPGWDDHMEDIGLDTDALLAAKRVLYEGTRENLEEGRWGKLSDGQLLEDYVHEFVWNWGVDVLVGRLWSSQDGKGRTNYPMILCVHCSGFPLRPAAETILPRLEQAARLCIEAASADQVRQIVHDTQADLDRFLESNPNKEDAHIDYHTALSGLSRHFTPEPGHKGLVRILYHMDREGGWVCHTPGKTALIQQRTHTRVPVTPGRQRETALLWTQFILGRLGAQAIVLVLIPVKETWMDIIVGEPGTAELYCLRASLEAIPVASSVPYNIDSDSIERIESLFQNVPDNS